MKTSPFQFLAPILCAGFAWSAVPSPAHAGKMDGINYLVAVTQMKASNANDEALAGSDKQQELIERVAQNRAEKEQVRPAQRSLELSAASSGDDAPQALHASRVVEGVATIAQFESTARADGLDDAELKTLTELVGVAKQRVDAATADASTEIAKTKQLLAETKTASDKQHIKVYLKSLRATVKAHRQTGAALRALAKKLSKSIR